MKFSKSLLSLVLILSPIFLSCSSEEINNHSSVVDDSSIGNPYISVVLRQDFYLNDFHYIMDPNTSINFDESFILIGYFVNACDLEYWQSYDNNPLLVYAIEENNTLINSMVRENLKNRFELYSINIQDTIGLRCVDEIRVYEKK